MKAKWEYFPLTPGTEMEYTETLASHGVAWRMRFDILQVREDREGVKAKCRRSYFDGEKETWDLDPEEPKTFTVAKRPDGLFEGEQKVFPLPLAVGKMWGDPPGNMFEVTSLKATAKVPAGEFKDCLVVCEHTSGEGAGAREHFYAPGVGLVLVKSTLKEKADYKLALTKMKRGEPR